MLDSMQIYIRLVVNLCNLGNSNRCSTQLHLKRNAKWLPAFRPNRFVKVIMATVILGCTPVSSLATECLGHWSQFFVNVINGGTFDHTQVASDCHVHIGETAAQAITGASSKNQFVVGHGVLYVNHTSNGASPTTIWGGQTITDPQIRQWWVDYLTLQRQPAYGLMSSEVLSPKYGAHVAGSVLQVLKKARAVNHADVVSAAETWLRAYWALNALGAVKGALSGGELLDNSTTLPFPAGGPAQYSNGLSLGLVGARLGGFTEVNNPPQGDPGGIVAGHTTQFISALALNIQPRHFNWSVAASPGFWGGLFFTVKAAGITVRADGTVSNDGSATAYNSTVIDASVFGLNSSQQAALRRIATATGSVSSQDLQTAINLVSAFPPGRGRGNNCEISFRRTAQGVSSWFGGADASQSQPICNNVNGYVAFGATIDHQTRHLSYLAPRGVQDSFRPDADLYSYRVGSQICAFWPDANGTTQQRCMDLIAGAPLYELYWTNSGLIATDGGGGGSNCPTNPPAYAYEIISTNNIGHPNSVECGMDNQTISITVRNTGSTTWVGDAIPTTGTIRFGIFGKANQFGASPDDHPFSSQPRAKDIPAGQSVACGETYTFEWPLNQFSNLTNGNHTLYLGMVRENEGWFRSMSDSSVWDTAVINVPDFAADVAISGPSSLQCNTTDTGQVTVTNRGALPWLNLGGDFTLRLTDFEDIVLETFGGGPGIDLPATLGCGQSQTYSFTAQGPDNGAPTAAYSARWRVVRDPNDGSAEIQLASADYDLTVNCQGACQIDNDCASGQVCVNGNCEIATGQCPAPPSVVINNDNSELPASGTVLIDVLANDSSPTGVPLLIGTISGPCQSAVSVLPGRGMLSVNSSAINSDCVLNYTVDYMGGGQAGNGSLTLQAGSGSSLAILQHPQSVTVNEGQQASFTVTADGAGFYQWLRNGQNTGLNQSSLILSSTTLAMSGDLIRVRVCSDSTQNECLTSNEAVLTVQAVPPSGQSPYGAQAIDIDPLLATRIEAENYDRGGQDIAYADSTPGTPGNNTYREPTGVELLQNTSGTISNNWQIAPVGDGEWLEYAIDAAPGTYWVAAGLSHGRGLLRAVSFDGSALDQASDPRYAHDTLVNEENTITGYYFQQPLEILPNHQTLRFAHLPPAGNSFNLDYLTLRPKCLASQPRQPYPGRGPTTLPANGTLVIEAEHYDRGCDAYWDTTTNQNLGDFTTGNTDPRAAEDVDLRYVGWANSAVIDRTKANEWTTYSFTLAESGEVSFTSVTFGNESNTTPILQLDILDSNGQVLAGPLSAAILEPDSGVRQTDFPAIDLGAGNYVLRALTAEPGYRLHQLRIHHAPADRLADPDTVDLEYNSSDGYQISGCLLRDGDIWQDSWGRLEIPWVSTNINLSLTYTASNNCGWRINFNLPAGTIDGYSFQFDYTFRDGGGADAPVVGPGRVTVNIAARPDEPLFADADTVNFDVADTDYMIFEYHVLDGDTPANAYIYGPDQPATPSAGALEWINHSTLDAWRLTPPAFHDGSPIQFQYRVIADGYSQPSNWATVTVNVPRHPLWASDDEYNIVNGTQTWLEKSQLLSNDDWDNPPIDSTPQLVIDSHNVIIEDLGNALLITPSAISNQQLTYHLTSADDLYQSPQATVNFTVLGAGYAPTTADETFDYPGEEASMIIPTSQLLANDSGMALIFHAITTPPPLSDGMIQMIDGDLVFTPSAGFTGITQFEYQVRDVNNVLAPTPGIVTLRSWPLQLEEAKKFNLILLQDD
ncbi:MAG: hypothetical protein Tsb002_09520 [Wenzhouxiangellaceae bacterium]